MSQFNYETYAEAIKGLALLPAELQQSQQKAEALFLNQKKQIEATTKSQLDELEKTENGNCTSMKITLSSNTRTRDFPATIPTALISSVCSTILKWVKSVRLSATN